MVREYKKERESKLVYYMFFLSVCTVYAFSNIRNLSMVMQLLFVSIIFLHSIKSGQGRLTVHFSWMIIFIAWGLIISLFAYDIQSSFNDIINLSLKLLFYTSIIIFIDDENKFFFALKTIVCAGIILSLRIIILTPIGVWGTDRLGFNMELNPNTIGLALSYAIIATVYLGKYLGKKVYYFASIPFTIIAFMTGSRKSFLIILFGIALLFLFSEGKKIKIKNIIILILIIWGLFELVMDIPYFYEILGKRLEGMRFISGKLNASSRTRLMMIQEAWILFKRSPIVGYGFENYRLISSFGTYSHNNYMELLTATGIVGTIIYYSLPFKTLISSIKNIKMNGKYDIVIIYLSIILFIDIAMVSYKHLITQVMIALCISYYLILINESKTIGKDKKYLVGEKDD